MFFIHTLYKSVLKRWIILFTCQSVGVTRTGRLKSHLLLLTGVTELQMTLILARL